MKRGAIIGGIIGVNAVVVMVFVPFIPTQQAYSEMEPYERQATYVVDDWDLVEKLGFFDVYVQSDVSRPTTSHEIQNCLQVVS